MLRKAPASSFLSPFPRFSVGCVRRPFVPRKVGRARDGRGNGRDPFSRSWKPRSRRQRRRRRQVSCTSLAARHHRRIPTPRHEEGRIAHIHRRCLLRSPTRRPSITPPPAKGWEGREEEAFSPRAASPSLRLLAPLPPSAEALVCIIGRLSPWGPRGGKENASSLSLVLARDRRRRHARKRAQGDPGGVVGNGFAALGEVGVGGGRGGSEEIAFFARRRKEKVIRSMLYFITCINCFHGR